MSHRRSVVPFLIVLVACSTPEAPPVSAPAGEGMPQLVRRPLTIADEDKPEVHYRPFDVASGGRIVYFATQEEAPLFRVLDSTGARVAAFGRDGEGPGEISQVFTLYVSGDTIRVHDSSRMRWIEMNMTGAFLRERKVDTQQLPVAWHDDSVDHWEPFYRIPGSGRQVNRSAIGGTHTRVLVDSTSVVFNLVVPARPQLPASLPFAATADRFWVGNGWTYKIGEFATNGSLIREFSQEFRPNERGPREIARIRDEILKEPKFWPGPNGERIPVVDQSGRLDTLEREHIAHFTRKAFHVDDHGRLWVIGVSRDSTSVDVFASDVFLGRVMLPCYKDRFPQAALGPGWLLLECNAEDGDWPTELQLYRIVER